MVWRAGVSPPKRIFTVNKSSWAVGDFIIYRKSKVSNSPGPRAKNVSPAKSGDSYGYTVDKYWVVKEVLATGDLVVRTARGKEHTLSPDDLALRKPYLWERWFFRARFRKLSESLEAKT